MSGSARLASIPNAPGIPGEWESNRPESGVRDLEFECRLRLPDNSVKHLRLVACRTIVMSRDTLEYIGAVQDVTHRRHTEETLTKLRAELGRATQGYESPEVLTTASAHEVNQPLAGIVTNAGTCQRMLAVNPPDVGRSEGKPRDAPFAMQSERQEVIKRLRALFCRRPAKQRIAGPPNEAPREEVALALTELEGNKVIVRTELAGELPPVPKPIRFSCSRS